MSWQPSAPLENLKLRAQLLRSIREFFNERDVLEVETPLLSQGTVTDVHLDPFVTPFDYHVSGQPQNHYLQTSPEFAMKRLLAAGSGPIYQITKAFRNEAAGRFHNPEFSMLEWYRPGFDDQQLMDEVADLVVRVLGVPSVKRVSYQQAFIQFLNIDPFAISFSQLQAFTLERYQDQWVKDETDKDVLLQWLFSDIIEPQLGISEGAALPCFVFDFPSSQASLAKINQRNPNVAHRFELYFKGIELANGFYELQDATEQRRRFEKDNQMRQKLGREQRPIDELFIDALSHGLPDCSGVALGVDRLLMCQLNAQHINQVISFDQPRC